MKVLYLESNEKKNSGKDLLLTVLGFQPVTLLKMRLQQRCFLVNFVKSLRTSFDRMLAVDCILPLSVNFENIFRKPLLLFYRWLLGNFLFHGQVAEFQPAHTVKNNFAGAFEVF